MKQLSKRLQMCLDLLEGCATVADVGCDHAYLACHLVRTGRHKKIIATDVIDGPLNQARKTIEAYGFEGQIELRKGSGFEPIGAGEVEGINVSGMGGRLISDFIEGSLDVARSVKKLVMQPQGGEAILRRTLGEYGFRIVDERLVEENELIYTIVVATPCSEVIYDEIDVMFGPILRKTAHENLFVKKWREELKVAQRTLERVPVGEVSRLRFEAKVEKIEEILGKCIDGA